MLALPLHLGDPHVLVAVILLFAWLGWQFCLGTVRGHLTMDVLWPSGIPAVMANVAIFNGQPVLIKPVTIWGSASSSSKASYQLSSAARVETDNIGFLMS